MYVLEYCLLQVLVILLVTGILPSKGNETCDRHQCLNNTHRWQYRATNDDFLVNCSFRRDSEADENFYKIKHCDHKSNQPMVYLGVCLTTDNNGSCAHVVFCPYDTGKDHPVISSLYIMLNATTAQEQNTFMCSGLNRDGLHCQSCNHSFGQSVFTFDLSCYNCHDSYSGWFLYLFFELFFLIIFLIVILVFCISPTNGNTNVFVLFCQLTMVCLSLGTEPYFKHMYGKGSSVYIQILKLFYGIWNLDFFRSVIPPFCVGSNLNNLDVLMLQYIPVLFTTILIVLAYFIVDLHERGFRPIVAVWGPFRRGLSHFSVSSDPKRKIVSFFATLVTLASTKVIYISFLVITTAESIDCCGNSQKVLYLQPDIVPYSKKHAPYIVGSFLMVSVYVFIPLLIILLYSLQSFQDALNKHCIRSHNIQMFTETFYNMYKDGSNGQWDTRLFSTVYIFFRILAVLFFVKLPVSFRFLGIALLQGFVLGLICLIRPYKNVAYTFLDASFFFIFLVTSVFSTGILIKPQCDTTTFLTFLYVIFLILIGTPLIYAAAQIIRCSVKALEFVNIHAILSWRRRGYVEIGPYETEESVAVDKDWAKTRKDQGRRGMSNKTNDRE